MHSKKLNIGKSALALTGEMGLPEAHAHPTALI